MLLPISKRFALALIPLLLVVASCGSSSPSAETDATASATSGDDTPAASADTTATTTPDTDGGSESTGSTETATFIAEVWADNWFALYVNGVLVGEDSVPITTERSFNVEKITFEATYPLTVAIEAKDFKETDSGIEYIGLNNQQMGDGGLIAQIYDVATGEVVAVTSSDWSVLVVHRAPLNTECEKVADPNTSCEFEIIETPPDWASATYDDSAWDSATEWTAGDVGPKDGYNEISWLADAKLVWGSDLEVDNTVLLRLTVAG